MAIVVGSTSPFSDVLNESEGRCTKAGNGRPLGETYATTWCDIDMVRLLSRKALCLFWQGLARYPKTSKLKLIIDYSDTMIVHICGAT